jgi:acrylyl-CoA reductase (NADPH)
MSFKAIVINNIDGNRSVRHCDFDEGELMPGDTVVRISHSSLNYKDGLAITGKAPVVRRFPMIPGIDFAGIIEATTSEDFKAGDAVILNGWGTGEVHLGGFAEKSRVPSKWLIPLPSGFCAEEAMAIGTAGYTASLCVLALERGGLTPDAGPVLVTGAAGGVGSVAVALLARAGWTVHAATGRPEEGAYLRRLGASEIVDRAELNGPVRPLAKERWAAAIDVVGSSTLANVLSMIRYGGCVAACGLAGGMDLPTSVAPFILRSVSLLGIDSVMTPKALRLEAWARLDRDLDRDMLAQMRNVIPLDNVIEAADRILAGQIRGRVVVEI